MMKRTLVAAVVAVATLGVPAASWAQSGSAIAGVVRDSSGGVLPGVTVEASSDALIERSRTVVTDGQGLYKIIDLRPGVYVVTFTLSGFNTSRREGIELTASFTATVNADLRVGSLAETITVTGQSSTVDIQNVVQQKVMTRDVIDAIPAGNKAVGALAVLIPGVITNNQDVGGSLTGSSAVAIHGSRPQEMQLMYDGMMYNNGDGRGGSFTAIVPNEATVQELSIETGGLSAESELSGIRTNVVPKQGGNTFRGSFFGAYTDDRFQSSNLTDELVASGLRTVDAVSVIYDVNPSIGGPLRKDKFWFFLALRASKTDQTVPGAFSNLTPGPVFTPDPSRPAHNDQTDSNTSLRLTWQATPRNKIFAQHQHTKQERPGFGYSIVFGQRAYAPEANQAMKSIPSYLSQIGWTAPLTARFLIEAGAAFANLDYVTTLQSYTDPNAIPYRDLSTNIAWGTYPNMIGHNGSHNFNTRLTTSYVTGSHAVKVGVTFMRASSLHTRDVANGGMTLQLLNTRPNQITLFATPLTFHEITKANVGVFAQDQWTVKRFTVNAGVRYDYLNSYVPAQHVGPGPWVPTREVDFPAVYNVPNWKDVSPRLGLSYDLSGNGRTAVKVSLGRYLEGPALTSFTRAANPAAAISTTATRSWNDANNDFLPQENELGPRSNVNFGNSVITSRYDDAVREERGFNWETAASIQHELRSNLSVTAGYHRRWYGNFRVTDNLRVVPEDYNPYCVTAPTDARLPNGGGYQVCGLHDIVQAKFGQTDNLITFADQFGKQSEVFNGVDFSVNARFPNGAVLSGGTSTGRTRTDNCFVIDSPQALLNCKVEPPFQTQVKLLGVYPLPWGLQTSATFQTLPGIQLLANYTVSSAVAAPSLGRNLSSGNATIPLIAPGTTYADRLYQLDLRFSRRFRFAGGRNLEGMVDLYNALNASTPLLWNNTFGTAWRPTSILQGRLVKFGLRMDF